MISSMVGGYLVRRFGSPKNNLVSGVAIVKCVGCHSTMIVWYFFRGFFKDGVRVINQLVGS